MARFPRCIWYAASIRKGNHFPPAPDVFQGGTKHTNNAGELTALLRAIYGEMGAQGQTTFMVDSTHALNTATGRTVPSGGKGNANRLLAVRLRVAYRLLQLERGSDVSIRHVKSHTGIRGNEVADKLANMGAAIEPGASRS